MNHLPDGRNLGTLYRGQIGPPGLVWPPNQTLRWPGRPGQQLGPTINLYSIPPKAGEVVRTLITAGHTERWWSRHGNESYGEAVGDLHIRDGLDLSRVWAPTSNVDTDFRLNVEGWGSIAAYVWGANNVGMTQAGRVLNTDAVSAPFGPGHGKICYVGYGDGRAPTIVELPLTTFRNTGAAWYNITVADAAVEAALDDIAVDALVNLVLADDADGDVGETDIRWPGVN